MLFRAFIFTLTELLDLCRLEIDIIKHITPIGHLAIVQQLQEGQDLY